MEGGEEGGVSIKQVKLKVLYTFDSEHKNNHLARWPQSIEVQVASIDEALVIGIINLRTCIEAIITASPELTSNLDNDYAVYAYDYSEPDTPLVGQGMLSKALSQENAEDQDSEAMVTGKITKSVMGLFSKNAQETLEVKLRLTPVASGFQRRRSGSISSNADTVQQQWNTLSQSNGAFRPSSPMDTSALETMQRMLSEGGPRTAGYQNESYHHPSSRPVSRSGTPAQLQPYNAPSRQSGPQSRPSSRSEMRQTHARRDSFNSGYYSGEEIVEEGPARKRAKIQKVDWPSKSNLNIERQPDSLRVVASTASSVRLHRPVPQYPGIVALQHGSPTEDPVRPPTPIPTEKQRKPRGRPKKVISSNLLLGPKARQSSPALQNGSAENSVSSPEDARADSITSTPAPMDLPSSPPVMPEQQNFVTSPALPPLNETDSGFMSGALDDLFDNNDMLDFGDFLQDRNGAPNMDFDAGAGMDIDLAAVFDEGNEDAEQAIIEMPPPNDKLDVSNKRPLARAQSMGSSNLAIKPAPKLAPALAPRNGLNNIITTQRACTALPPIPASDPIGRSFQRSNTWAPDMTDAIMSDIGPNGDDASKSKSKKRVGKEQTKARLEQAIASGEMPPFCDNCGAIETPAWRRAYTKLFDTPFDEFQTSLEQGECCYKEPVEHDEDGSVKLWKGYRTEKRADEKSADSGGWTQICLCNPCGLWFHKSKYPRPPEKWQKRDPNEKRKRKRKPKPKKKSNRPIVAKSDAFTPASDDSSPGDDAADGGDGDDYGDEMTANEDNYDDNEPQLPPMPANYRAGSAEPAGRGFRTFQYRKTSGGRQVQSSPAPVNKTQSVNTITPRPLRRQLFPSPDSLQNKANAVAIVAAGNGPQLPGFVRRSPRLNKVRDMYAGPTRVSPVVEVEGEGKENLAPTTGLPDSLNDLFDDHDNELMLPPATPTPKRRSERLLFKTPGRTPSREFGVTLDQNTQEASPSLKTPKNKIQHVASILISTVQRNLNPSEMTPFTRSIHDALHNQVPGDLPSTPQTRASARSKRTPRRISPRNMDLFDFPDLPSLKGSSPSNGAPPFALDFSELPTDRLQTDFNDMFSTDAHMPSSPPSGYFNFMDMAHQDLNPLWDMTDSQGKELTRPEPLTSKNGAALVEKEFEAVRRSPRKHVA